MKKYHSYDDVRNEVEKPIKDRQSYLSNRGNVTKPRRYHMDEEDAKTLRANFKATGIFPNPYRATGVYHVFIQSLVNLGVNKIHSFSNVKKEMIRVMKITLTPNGKTLWDNFHNKQSRSLFGARDINGKIVENALVLQRISGNHPFGEKLRQLHCCVDISADNNGLPCFKLNTTYKTYKDVKPSNTYRKHRSPDNRS